MIEEHSGSCRKWTADVNVTWLGSPRRPPLSFVPIGVLRGEQFYNLDEMIDEARFNVAYRAWRHILLEVDKDLWRLTALPVPLRAMIVLTARVGGRYILDIMHRFARSK